MKNMIIFLSALIFAIPLFAEDLAHRSPTFTYRQQDGEFNVPCVATVKDEFRRDWDVLCQKGSFSRKYSVHWLARDYGPNSAGNGMVEILYWVTDHQIAVTAPGHFVGTTLRMKLKTYSSIDNIEMTVDVDNIAGLDMSL